METQSVPIGGSPHGSEDQRVFLHGVRWADYERLLAIRGESSVPRLTYLEGELELMTPSIDHEAIAETIGRLLDVFAQEHDIDLQAYGSWTLKRPAEERGAEPDKCYIVGPKRPPAPDFAIEVVWTSGGIDKLAVYRDLGVKEVWFWTEGRLQVYRLRGKRYIKARRSGVLPALDLPLLARFIDPAAQMKAVRAFRAALRR